MEHDALSTEQILDRLRNPKELAKAYLGDLISSGTGFNWNRFLTICAFYSFVGFSGFIVIPTLAFIAFGFTDLNPIAESIISLIVSVLIYLAGRGTWKSLLSYMKKVGNKKRELSI